MVKHTCRKGRSFWNLATAVLLALGLALASGCGVTETVSRYYADVTNYFLTKDTHLNKRVVVIPFTSRLAGMGPKAEAIFKAVSARVSKAGGLTQVNVKRLQSTISQLGPEPRRREERILSAARLIGLNSIVDAQITDLSLDRHKTGIYGFRENTPFLKVELLVKIWDVPNGALLATKSFTQRQEIDNTTAQQIEMGQQKPDPKKVEKIADKLAEPAARFIIREISNQAWTGYLLAREGERVKVTVSSQSGMPVGTVLAVYAKGEPIKAGSGRVYYLPGSKVGQIKVGELGEETSWAVPLPGTKLEALKPGLLLKTK